MTYPAKIAAQLAAEIGKPQNADLIERQLVQDGRVSRILSGYPLYSRPRSDDPCPCCEGRGTVPPAGNRPYFDREEVLCVECDGTGESA